MMTRTPEWLNANRYRRYPFRDDTNLTCTGSRALSNDVLLDCRLVSCTSAQAALSLSNVEVTAGQLICAFSYGSVSFYVTVPAAASYPYTVTGSALGLQYTLIFGEGCKTLLAWPVGTYSLNESPVLQPTLTVVQDRHRVDTVRATGSGQTTLSGLVYIEPGYNCEPVVMPNKIRLSAGLGYGAGRYCNSLNDAVRSCAEAILWVNGQNADEAGNLPLVGGPGVEVESQPDQNRVVIRGNTLLEQTKCG
jgi:hypothetical protein